MPSHRPALAHRRIPLALTGAITAAALTACSAIGIEPNTFTSGPLPAVRDDGVAPILATIDGVVNEANAARDPALLATVYGEPLLGIDVAAYALDSTADPENAEPLPEVNHSDPTVFIPRFQAYPQWFVTAASIRPDAPLRLEVLGRDSAAGTWITSMSTDLLADVAFPELALDDAGYVIPVDLGAATGSASTADEVAAAHAAALGGTDDASGEVAAFADDAWTTARKTADAQRGEAVADAATVAVAYEVTGALPMALETADGGTLVFYALAEDVTYTVQPTFFLQLDEATAAIVGTAEITTSLTERWAMQLAVYVPPETGGAARVIGARVDRVALTGT